jgi:hypothetical protein
MEQLILYIAIFIAFLVKADTTTISFMACRSTCLKHQQLVLSCYHGIAIENWFIMVL